MKTAEQKAREIIADGYDIKITDKMHIGLVKAVAEAIQSERSRMEAFKQEIERLEKLKNEHFESAIEIGKLKTDLESKLRKAEEELHDYKMAANAEADHADELLKELKKAKAVIEAAKKMLDYWKFDNTIVEEFEIVNELESALSSYESKTEGE